MSFVFIFLGYLGRFPSVWDGQNSSQNRGDSVICLIYPALDTGPVKAYQWIRIKSGPRDRETRRPGNLGRTPEVPPARSGDAAARQPNVLFLF